MKHKDTCYVNMLKCKQSYKEHTNRAYSYISLNPETHQCTSAFNVVL